MKKLFATLALSTFAIATFAQGTVNWSGVAGLFVAQTNATAFSPFVTSGGTLGGTVGSTLGNTVANNTSLGYSGYYYTLLLSSSATAPTTVAGLTALGTTPLTATNGASSNGRIIQVASGTAIVVNNWALGGQTNVVLAGWSGNLGTTWAAVLNKLQNWSTTGQSSTVGTAFFGLSNVGTLTSGTADPGVVIFGTGAGQINNPLAAPAQLLQVGVSVVPEPGTMVLAGLGGLAMLALRRKK